MWKSNVLLREEVLQSRGREGGEGGGGGRGSDVDGWNECDDEPDALRSRMSRYPTRLFTITCVGTGTLRCFMRDPFFVFVP